MGTETENVAKAALGAKIARLKQLRKLFDDATEFQSGDIVTWKDGLKNKKRPGLNEPAIVLAHQLSEPIVDDVAPPGTQYYLETLDLKLGILDEDGEFAVYYFDSRRFRKLE
jgi:hypothetical protein